MSHDRASSPWRTGVACVGPHNDTRDSMKGTLVSIIRKAPPEKFLAFPKGTLSSGISLGPRAEKKN